MLLRALRRRPDVENRLRHDERAPRRRARVRSRGGRASLRFGAQKRRRARLRRRADVRAGGARARRRATCCANTCDAGRCAATSAACKPAGEACGGDPSAAAASARWPATARRVARLQAYRMIGEICATGADCCSATCTFDASAVGHCAPLPSCTTNDTTACTAQVDDACAKNGDCCSRRCEPTSDGTKRCAPAGGCRLQCELCSSNAECCSGACVGIADGIWISTAAGACGKAGEECTANPQCCTTGPGPAGRSCAPVPGAPGVQRCRVGPPPPPDAGAPSGAACAIWRAARAASATWRTARAPARPPACPTILRAPRARTAAIPSPTAWSSAALACARRSCTEAPLATRRAPRYNQPRCSPPR